MLLFSPFEPLNFFYLAKALALVAKFFQVYDIPLLNGSRNKSFRLASLPFIFLNEWIVAISLKDVGMGKWILCDSVREKL